MTLQEWCDRHKEKIMTTSSSTAVYAELGSPARSEVWGLSDYLVMTVSGPVCWMVRRDSKVPYADGSYGEEETAQAV